MFLNLLVILLFPTNALELSLLYENIIQLNVIITLSLSYDLALTISCI